MKKRFMVGFFMLLSTFALSGCKEDNKNAIVEITTSTGEALVDRACNGIGTGGISGAEIAMNNPCKLTLQDGDTAKVHFYCDACGYDEELLLTAPVAKMLSCDCPEDGDEDGNGKEYVVVLLGNEVE